MRSLVCAGAALFAGVGALASEPLSPDNPPKFETTSKETVLLRYKLKPDQVLKIVMETDAAVKVKQGEEDVKMTQSMRIEAKTAITEVDAEGNISAVTKITRLKMSMKGLATVEYDSDRAKEADPAFKSVTAMINVGIPVKMSPVGEMLEEDLEPLKLAARKAGDAAMAKSIEDGTKKMFEGTFMELSKEPVKTGETYKSGTVVEDNMKSHVSYKILAINGDKTKVLMEPKSKIELLPDAFPGAEAKLRTQEMKGWQLFDVEKGCPGDMQARVHLVFDIKEKGEGGEKGVVDTTATIKLTMTLQ